MSSETEFTAFLLNATGQIEYAQFLGGVPSENIYLRYYIVSGPDWQNVSGVNSGLSQLAVPGRNWERITFNMPVDITLKSTNPFGWPQLVIVLYGLSFRGTESVHGYGRVHFPTSAGNKRLVIPLFAPKPSSTIGEVLSWLTGRKPELLDPKMLAEGKNLYLLRMQSYGSVVAEINVITKDFHKLGYDNRSSLLVDKCEG